LTRSSFFSPSVSGVWTPKMVTFFLANFSCQSLYQG
jgi:hypothetical protein